MPERYISELRKAWVDPQGIVHEVHHPDHHLHWLQKNHPEIPFHESTKLGWIRLTRRGQALDVEGTPRQIDRYKAEITMWAGPHTQWVNVDPQGQSPFESSYETFLDESVARMAYTSRMVGGTVFRRRPREQVFVKTHKRKKVGVYPKGRYFRERQFDPSKCQPGTMRTIDVGKKGGHKAVICRPRGKKTTRTQSILHPRTAREAKKLGLPKHVRRRTFK